METKKPKGLISKLTIDKIREAANILDVVSEFYELKKNGNSYKMKSPKTGEKTASFYVVPDKNFFKDFSTGEKGGDSIRFLMDYENMSYAQAIEWLAKKYGIEINRDPHIVKSVSKNHIDEKTETFQKINTWMMEQFEEQLWNKGNGSKALDHLVGRGVTEELIKKYHLGYALPSFDNLKKLARQKFPQSPYTDLTDTSVVKRSTKNPDHFYDFFYDRVMFPIMNQRGQTLGFGGRTLHEKKEGDKEDGPPKYVNSYESYIFKKGATFFGLYQALEAIRKLGFVYIVEGYMDVLAFAACGIFNVVSLNGTAMTEGAIKMLLRFTANFVIAMDGDAAGKKAVFYQLPLLLKFNNDQSKPVQLITFPEGMDPSEFFNKRDEKTFVEFVEKNKQNFVYEIIRTHWVDNEDPQKKAKILRELVNYICFIENRIQRNVYLTELSKRTGFPFEVIREEEMKIEINREKRMKEHLDKMEELQNRYGITPETTLMKILVKFSTLEIGDGVYLGKYLIDQIERVGLKLHDEHQRKLTNAISFLIYKKTEPTVENLKLYFPELETYINTLLVNMKGSELTHSRTTNPARDEVSNLVKRFIIESELAKTTDTEVKAVLTKALKTYPNFA